jgi:hypothetical protein
MHLLDWLRDGLLSEDVSYRHVPPQRPLKRVERQERADPSGPHHFGRRAHRPDPNARYGFNHGPGGTVHP